MAISNRLACATQQICACLFLAFAGVLPTTSSAHASTFTTIWNFKGGASDGAYPISAPGPAAAIGPDGSLFVTTSADGAHGYGAVVKLMPPASAKQPWTEQVIYSFAKNVGEPISVVAGGKGVLYGTWYAESPQCGFAFRLVEPANAIPPWTLTVLHTFTGGMDGCGPFGGLTRRADGYLYGSTLFGGGSSNCGNGCGTIYALKPQTAAGNWQSKIMLAFDGTNGSLPYDAPVLEKPLAEKTSRIIEPFWIMLLCADYDGDDHAGVLQEFSLPKTSNIVHGLLWNWEAGLLEGAYPMASPTPLPSGEQKSETDTTAQPTMVVGTTTGGGVETAGCLNQGNDGCGTVYELTVPTKKKQKWKLTNLHLFAGGNDGAMPIARLVVTATGVIYGTTVGADTASDNGTIFSLTPSSSSPTGYKYSVLHRFSGASYLGFPEGGLASDGNALYGVTKYGGTGTACKSGVGCGTVFKFVP